MTIAEQLRPFLGGSHVVALDRGDLPSYSGVPVAVSDSLVVLRSLHEFFVDGFIVLRLEDITAVNNGPSQQFTEMVLQGERLIDATAADNVRVSSLSTLLADVQQRFGAAVIEDENDDEFILGEVSQVGTDDVSVRYISADGVVELEPTRMALDRITRVSFGDRYSLLCAKYAKRLSVM